MPSADPAITAAGGTTTPLTLRLTNPPPGTPDLVVTTEQVWGWDYIQDYLVQVRAAVVPERAVPGRRRRRREYLLVETVVSGRDGRASARASRGKASSSMTAPAPDRRTFSICRRASPGRNVPDVSLDADPFSGFMLFSTEDGGLLDGFGGTSFVAPQLNGISALLVAVDARPPRSVEPDAVPLQEDLRAQQGVSVGRYRRRRQLVLPRRCRATSPAPVSACSTSPTSRRPSPPTATSIAERASPTTAAAVLFVGPRLCLLTASPIAWDKTIIVFATSTCACCCIGEQASECRAVSSRSVPA